jgi:flagellar biosynthetic protein FliP
MVGLALFLTLFVMGPTVDRIYTEAYVPLQENRIQMGEAMDKAAAPLKGFMLKQTRQADLALFVKISRTPALQGPEDVPLRVLIPSFITSELKTAFQIGFAIFIPVLIIDMVVASVLMSMGMMMMSFTRIIIVLSLLRQALGTQTAPPNQVMVGLALFLTLFVMGPTFDRIYNEAYVPLQDNRIQMGEAMDKAAAPLKGFMLKQTRQSDLALFVKISRTPALQGPEDVPLRVLIPSFITSELKTAFQIGFAIFIPFLIIDMVVASVLMSMGMMMMSPAVISLPFKLMLFVLVDGWQLLLGSLSQSFY